MQRQKPARKAQKIRTGRPAITSPASLRQRRREAVQIAFALCPLPFGFCLAPAYEPARRS